MAAAPEFDVRSCSGEAQLVELIRQAARVNPKFNETILACAAGSAIRANNPPFALFAYVSPKETECKPIPYLTGMSTYLWTGPPPRYPVVRCVFHRGAHVLWGDVNVQEQKWITRNR